MIPQTTELSQIQAAFIDKDSRIEELMRQINSAQSLLNSLKDTMNSLVGDGKITIQTYEGSNVGDFTVNQKKDKTITLPQQATVNNGTLTIQKNGTSVGTFTANQSGNTTANITVPTKTSEITNDSNFVSDANYVHTDNNFTNADKAEIGKINNSLQFTYVVDSDQKLADWANNVAGNDYTSVLVRKNSNGWNLPQNKKLMANGCLLLTGEAGAQINIINTTGSDIINDFQVIQNLNFNVNWTAASGTANWCIFYHCKHIKDVTLTIEHYNPNNKTSYLNLFNSGDDVNNVSASIHTNNTLFNANLFRYQSNANNVTINITGNHTGGTFRGVQGGRNYSRIKINNSGAALSYGMSGVLRVMDCQMIGFSTPYYDSYSSPTVDSTYACANTLNGGWNTTT